MAKTDKLNLFDFTMIMVTLVIGMGIFRTPVNVAAQSATPFIFFASWIAGGLVAICGALTYAEIGSRMPVTGAYYKIFSTCYHPSLAFAINCIILVSNAASLAAVALIGSEYIGKLIWGDNENLDAIQVTISIVSILIFYGINLLGLKMSARTQNILAIIKIGMVILLIVPLFLPSSYDAGVTMQSAEMMSPTLYEYTKSFGVGLVAVSFTYGGYQQTINFGGEVKQPDRNIPRGIFIGISIIILLYLLINFAYYKVIGFENLKTATGIAAIMASHVLGPLAGNILSVLLFLSVLAYVNVLLMSNPRVMYAMSEDGVLPAMFMKRRKHADVLVTALSVFAGSSVIILFFARQFDEILSFTIFLDCIGMATSAATIFILRRRSTQMRPGNLYQMKLYPLLPLIFIAAYLFVGVSIFLDKPATAATGIAVLLSFILLFFLVKFVANRKTTTTGHD
jgi:basic amino acid/polyamine antiporter, APA family